MPLSSFRAGFNLIQDVQGFSRKNFASLTDSRALRDALTVIARLPSLGL
jgi:hypothetical protein